ncbi:DsrE family protein [Criibacterium bergeronii]|uniref:Uncharacterized protein n=1 Tax=Criibacterium bergeronii TaxID=1871336 RepID=A0A371IK78_9FIRM|nr:hypothetical protein [Criibacterium bergeronii]MBS6063088.1 hypothetical protein [Peptostreptococcaceae bacterium]RDY20902.1 hypothetical protein BBG48_007505 [Criibacterium bergeronii]TRW26955.1 hypothetical protein FL857_04390 [Criibacterium bergeronii]
MNVIFHVVEAEKWTATLDNARDILSREPQANIEIIAMSKAAGLFGSYSGQSFEGLIGNPRVKFVIGTKGLIENNLTKELLPQGIEVEESAITRIARLQTQGYAYIRL